MAKCPYCNQALESYLAAVRGGGVQVRAQLIGDLKTGAFGGDQTSIPNRNYLLSCPNCDKVIGAMHVPAEKEA